MTEREAAYRLVGFVWGTLAGALVGLGALVLCLAACVAVARGAPLPKPPEVTADTLAGATWRYSWGQYPDGVISFRPDGTYAAVHAPDGGPVYYGTWWVRDGVVRLNECRFDPASGAVYGPTAYEFSLTAAPGCTRLSGAGPGGLRVILSDPRR